LQSTTITDPTGKQIRRKQDAAGRLVEVDEPNTSLSGADASASLIVSGSLNSTTTTVTGSAPVAATNSALTSFVASDGSSHTFYLGTNQHIYHLFWNSTGSWQDQDVSSMANSALAASGSALTSFASSDGNYHVVYFDANNHVNQLAGGGSNWSNQDITAAAGAGAAASGSALAGYAGTYAPHIYYQGTNQHIYQFWLNGSTWVNNDLTAASGTSIVPPSGTKLTSFLDSLGEHSFYRGQDNHVYQLFWNGSTLANQDLMDMAALDLVDGPCAPENGICYWGSQAHVVGFGANGAYNFLTVSGNVACNVATFGDPAPGVLKACYLVNSGFPVAAAGSKLASVADSNGEHVYYLTSNGHSHHLWFDGENWHDQDQTSFAGTSVVAASGSALTSFTISSDGSEHVIYLGTNNHVYDMSYSSVTDWVNTDLTASSGATVTAVAGGALTSFGLSAGNPGHVQYLTSNGHLYHLYWNGSVWQNQDLMNIAANLQTVFDAGLVSLTVGSFTGSACFGASTNSGCSGQNNPSAREVASALAQAMSASTSPVTATATGSTITLTMKAGGYSTATVNPLSTTHDNSSLFSTPSFTSAPANFSGGSNYPPVSTSPNVTTFTYNVLDQIVAITQGSQTRNINYDSLGRELSEMTPEAGTVNFVHDDFGLATQRTDNRGVVTSYTYDKLNRMTAKSYPTVPVGVTAMPNNICDPASPTGTNLVANTCFYYDQGGAAAFALGHLTTIVDPSGSETYTFDQLGRVTQRSKVINGTNGGNAYVVKYQYNLASEVTQVQYPSGRQVKPTFDALGRMAGITDTMGSTNTTYASGMQYNAASQMTGFNYGNGVAVAYGYSSDRLQMTSLSYTKDGTTLFGLTYGYSQNGGNGGEISSIIDTVDSGRSVSYVYDAVGRLKQASTAGSTNFPNWDLAFGYDRYGNRLSETPQSDTSPNASVPSNTVTVNAATNQISTGGYSYDAAGNMTNDGVNALTYDGENRASSSSGLGGTAIYIYDSAGLRVRKCSPDCTNPTSSTAYIFSGKSVIAEYDNTAASDSPSREYINSTQGLLATIDSSGTKYHLRDHLSVRLTTDGNGNKIGEQGHFPFGESWYKTNTPTKWVFTSYERDPESGNDYAQARVYVNRLARFNTPDPVSGLPAFPQSLNRYAYAANDPINLVDPSGLLMLCTGWEVFIVTFDPEGREISRQDTGIFIVDECFDFGDGGGGGGGGDGGGGGGGGSAPATPTIDKKVLQDCIEGQFAMLLLSFTPDEKGVINALNKHGSATLADELGEIGTVTVEGDDTKYIKEQVAAKTGRKNAVAFTDKSAPAVNYQAQDLNPDQLVAYQIWELGNSLGAMTHITSPAVEDTLNPKDKHHEPGLDTINCYLKGIGQPPINPAPAN
jgi:RHS repeat-associated protein